MTSPKQIEANRKNAGRSTGPRTAAGKAVVSQNAVRHGLRAQRVVIEGESQAEFDDFRNRLIDQLAPADTMETLLADRIAAGFWRLRRTGQIEARIFDEMRQALYAEQKQAAGPADDPRFDDVLLEDFNSLPSGLLKAFEESDADASFRDPTALPDAIAKLKQDCHQSPELVDRLSEWERSARAAAEIPPGRYSIPAAREQLCGLLELVRKRPEMPQKFQTELERAVVLLLFLEELVERRRKPNLGKTLHRDFKGANILDKFIRYESRIERSLYKAMHELQRLQAGRQTGPSAAPIAIDMNITADKIPWKAQK